MTSQRLIRNPSGYHSSGKTPKDKVHNFCLFIKDFGWTGKWWIDEESDILHCKMTRDDNERIEIEWPANQWWPDVWYTYAVNTIKCRNISAAAKIAQDEPDPERMRKSSRRLRADLATAALLGPNGDVGGRNGAGVGSDPNGEVDPAEAIVAALTSYVPWDKESTAEEVRAELINYRNPTVTWVNRLTGEVNTAMIKTRSKHFKVTENKEGRVIISFADEFGFHSTYANNIIGVK